MEIKMYDYDVVNANNAVIDTITACNKKQAAFRLRKQYGENIYFLQLKETGKTRKIEI